MVPNTVSAAVRGKALRYLATGRVRALAVTPGFVVFDVQGSDRYRVVIEDEDWTCSCPARRPCAHLHAVLQVTGSACPASELA